MLKRAKKREITWPVTVNVPQDGGTVKPYVIDVKFAPLNEEETAKAIGESKDILDVVVIGWDKYMEEDGTTPIAFNDETKKEFLNVPYHRVALFGAYGEIQNGRGARKN